MTLPTLRLQKNQDRRLQAGHLWIYNNEINNTLTPLTSFTPGELVQVEASNGKPLGIAYVNPKTLLCGRLLTRDPNETIDTDFFIRRIQAALTLRQKLFAKPYYRLVYGESDGLPGLIMDQFGETLVGQINTAGMDLLVPHLLAALQEVIKPKNILWRNDSSYRVVEGLTEGVTIGLGTPPELCRLEENDCLFDADIWHGQKTGWYYDHRFARARLAHYVKDKTVLDLFSYTGAFGVQMAKAGASHVTCVDSSGTALKLLAHNAQLNKVESKITTLDSDVFTALADLKNQNKKFDVIIADPPAFIKRKKDSAAGTQAYLRVNELAASLLAENGVLLSASCSMHLSRDELLDVIRRASLKTGRSLTVLEQLHQAPDHPVDPAIEETNYLKGFILGRS
ncbi:MAG: class I SAM-dependent rRNA methyltransferase [Gammaproteobacteria bacterium]|nr:class I SAM-dependent rRNA methyltransferase [Gammaproteobacteria bacterium]